MRPTAASSTGINFEFSYNARHWDPNRYTSEIRPILGWRFGPVDLIFNPILDNSYQGVSRLDSHRRRGWLTIFRKNGRWQRRSMTISDHCADFFLSVSRAISYSPSRTGAEKLSALRAASASASPPPPITWC